MITESLGLDRDARQAEICAKSNADIFFFPTLLCLPSAGHQQIMSPISLSPRHMLRQHASMPSQWVHARGQAHWVRGGVPGLSKGQGGRGGLGSLSLILLYLPLLTLTVCPVPTKFTYEHKCMHSNTSKSKGICKTNLAGSLLPIAVSTLLSAVSLKS